MGKTLEQIQLQDALKCCTGEMDCYTCSMNKYRFTKARVFKKGTNIKDTGCFLAVVETALELN